MTLLWPYCRGHFNPTTCTLLHIVCAAALHDPTMTLVHPIILYVCFYMCIHVCVCVYVCMYVCITVDMYTFKCMCAYALDVYLLVCVGMYIRMVGWMCWAGKMLQASLNASDGDTTSLEFIVRVQVRITWSGTSWWHLCTIMTARILSEASSHDTRNRAHLKAMGCSTAILLCFCCRCFYIYGFYIVFTVQYALFFLSYS